MTVASIDAETGRTVLISLPRNMEDVPFPASSPMHKKFPKGFGCKDHTCMLNAVYTYASTHPGIYPDSVKDPGVQATKEAIEGAIGLKINYYAMVDMKGFEALVDAVGGIPIDVNRRIPIGGGHAKLYGYVEKGNNQQLDGRSALWFARSRSDSSDYDRMARQKCVMNAMLNQLDPVTVLTNFNQIASAGKEIVETDIPPRKVDTLMELALQGQGEADLQRGVRAAGDLPGQPELREDAQDGGVQDRQGGGQGRPEARAECDRAAHHRPRWERRVVVLAVTQRVEHEEEQEEVDRHVEAGPADRGPRVGLRRELTVVDPY